MKKKRKQTGGNQSDLEKFNRYGDPFFPKALRHYRGRLTPKSKNKVHPALVVGEWPDDYLAMGAETDRGEDETASKRKKYIRTPQNRTKSGEPTRIRKQIQVHDKRDFSKEKYDRLYLTEDQHDAVDRQISKKMAYWKQKAPASLSEVDSSNKQQISGTGVIKRQIEPHINKKRKKKR